MTKEFKLRLEDEQYQALVNCLVSQKNRLLIMSRYRKFLVPIYQELKRVAEETGVEITQTEEY